LPSFPQQEDAGHAQASGRVLLAALAVITSLSVSSAVAAPRKGGSGGTTGAAIAFDRPQVMVGETYHVI